ncbi:hypothetical protein KIW84_022294 [Lathyrus oleraceus]|uniref:MCM C-terminal AAA(+) ATPase domain-containing protein n=1 Tax=Pisum sativum TaxID=3888 RepID=A0A9D4YFY3_PEA|nr:hypothetical protein KIW84_022294 [Pisum sativum]
MQICFRAFCPYQVASKDILVDMHTDHHDIGIFSVRICGKRKPLSCGLHFLVSAMAMATNFKVAANPFVTQVNNGLHEITKDPTKNYQGSGVGITGILCRNFCNKEGVNKCSSLDCLGRRLGPRLLGRFGYFVLGTEKMRCQGKKSGEEHCARQGKAGSMSFGNLEKKWGMQSKVCFGHGQGKVNDLLDESFSAVISTTFANQSILNARTSILAAANPAGGRYDKSKPLKYKVAFPPAKAGQEKSRYGFVHFADRSCAMKALKNTEKYEIDGQILECSLAKPQADQKSSGYGATGFAQPLMYGPGATPAGMAMMPMFFLPDGRIAYVLQQPRFTAVTLATARFSTACSFTSLTG